MFFLLKEGEKKTLKEKMQTIQEIALLIQVFLKSVMLLNDLCCRDILDSWLMS